MEGNATYQLSIFGGNYKTSISQQQPEACKIPGPQDTLNYLPDEYCAPYRPHCTQTNHNCRRYRTTLCRGRGASICSGMRSATFCSIGPKAYRRQRGTYGNRYWL